MNLEKRLVNENMNKLSFVGERKTMIMQLKDLKDKYNEELKQKGDYQAMLLRSEEEKLALSQSVIQLQIENAKLQEQFHLSEINKNAENSEEAINIDKIGREYENAKKNIHSLENKLEVVLHDKRDLESEFMSLKKNFIEKCNELESVNNELDRVKLQLIKGTNRMGNLNNDYASKIKNNTKMELENDRLKEELEEVRKDLNRARNDKANMELYVTKLKLQIENSKFQENTDKNDSEEILEWRTRCKRFEKDIIGLKIEVQNLIEERGDFDLQNKTLKKEVNEIKKAYRDKLVMAGAKIDDLLIKSMLDGESQLKKLIEDLSVKYLNIRKACVYLRKRSEQLKNLCEDLIPKGSERMDILDEREPQYDSEIEADTFLMKFIEFDNLRKSYEQVKIENEVLKSKLGQGDMDRVSNDELVQQKILEELKALRGGRSSGIPNEEFERIKREKMNLLEENRRLKMIV